MPFGHGFAQRAYLSRQICWFMNYLVSCLMLSFSPSMTGLRTPDYFLQSADQATSRLTDKEKWDRQTLSTYPHCHRPSSSPPCLYPAAAQTGRALGGLSLNLSVLPPLQAWTKIHPRQAALCSAQTRPPMMPCCQRQRSPQQTRRTWVPMNWSCWPNWRSRTGESCPHKSAWSRNFTSCWWNLFILIASSTKFSLKEN